MEGFHWSMVNRPWSIWHLGFNDYLCSVPKGAGALNLKVLTILPVNSLSFLPSAGKFEINSDFLVK